MQELLHGENKLVYLLKTAIDMMSSDADKVVINADKIFAGEQVGKLNASTIDEVAIVIVRDKYQPRDMILYRRND